VLDPIQDVAVDEPFEEGLVRLGCMIRGEPPFANRAQQFQQDGIFLAELSFESMTQFLR